MKKLFTSESVTEGHPDKVCDLIADRVLDAVISQDKHARVACEAFATTGIITIMGEITTTASVDFAAVARDTVCSIGYNCAAAGFDGNTCAVSVAVDRQSPDIAMGVDRSFEHKSGENDAVNLHGAGDQGMMFGYACNETAGYMPISAYYAHKLTERLAAVRKDGLVDFLCPDGKAQITVEYNENNEPVRIDTVVLSTQHSANTDIKTVRSAVRELVIDAVLPKELVDADTEYYINPTGRFVIGGPQGDTGLTGRKIIVDTYGGVARHGGGAFSGKDPTKVDRSAAYAARYAAKNIVAAGIADKCELQIAYAIGVAKPVSVFVDTFGTGKIDDLKIAQAVTETFDFRPYAIIRDLDLLRPIYAKTCNYGHFGRDDADFIWERTDKADLLLKAAGLSK